MIDISQTIAPKSDQLNADDLIGRPMTIRVSRVSKMDGDQPVSIHFEGDGGRPYKPCKSMRRVLVRVWGVNAADYAGRRMTLYRDDEVRFGGVAVGGIRISHMSGLGRDLVMPLTDKRGSRKPYTVKPLAADRGPAPGGKPDTDAPKPKTGRERLYEAAREAARKGTQDLQTFRDGLNEQQDGALAGILPELERIAADADAADDGSFPGADSLNERAA